MKALFLLWTALEGNVFTDLNDVFYLFLSWPKKKKKNPVKKISLIQPSFDKPIQYFIQFWLSAISFHA